MLHSLTQVVIVGGGTAGWLTAARIAAYHKCQQANAKVQVTLIESSDVPPVGVGEGTWPTMRATLQAVGISETEFLRECDASFKQGAKFAKWTTGAEGDFYYHPLMLPQGFPKFDLTPYWQQANDDGMDISYSNAVCFQEALCEQGLAPKLITTAEFSHVANYAYHLDAGKFASLLKKHSINKLGVRHIVDHVVKVNNSVSGDIATLTTKAHGEIAGDLFVDCTGFQSLLLGQHYQVPFVDQSDVLFIDNALALHVPYQSADEDIVSHTVSTAQSAGWIWDIGLPSRRGVGHVYSSKHTNEQAAADELYQYVEKLNPAAVKDFNYRKIPIQSGHRQRFWHNNCVAVGLAAGFLEPLEASAIVLVELSATMIAEQLPHNRSNMDIVAKRFNQTFQYRWARIIDFLKLHYVLTKRQDSQFWRDNQDLSSCPQELVDLLSLWSTRAPADYDFTSNNEVFPAASYLYVLYGMGFKTDFSQSDYLHQQAQQAAHLFQRNQQMIKQSCQQLPKNRELLNKIAQYGLNKI
ncbi:tryptophan halogenase family protein [Catenovulum agarivorans]|uniref:tryptophan halogenase family protein n=1 Tax=Catenovulum agarivorans TaxID=1172192 RepID=UPI000318BB00|nr:tryptophan halogenase family protein [Catenovulum agarivorans]